MQVKIKNILIIGTGNMANIRSSILNKKFQNINLSFIGIENKISSRNVNQKLLKHNFIFLCATPRVNNKYLFKILENFNNKFIFCEKNSIKNFDCVKKINFLLKKNSSNVIKFGFNHRYYEPVNVIKKIISDKKIGNLVWIRGRYGKGENFNTPSWRTNIKESFGGILHDQGLHLIDLIFELTDIEFKYYASSISKPINKFKVDDNTFLLLKDFLSKNVNVSLQSSSTIYRYEFSLELVFSNGKIIWNGLRTNSKRYGSSKLSTLIKNKQKDYFFNNNLSFLNETNDFFSNYIFDSVKQKNEFNRISSLTKIIDKCYKNGF